MKYTRGQFTNEYYQLWSLGLLLPIPENSTIYSVKYRKNYLDQYSRVTLKAVSVSDALERACYAITYASPWRPEEVDLHAVYDNEENILWIDEIFYEVVQKKNEFRGMPRRDFLALFGATSAVALFGLSPSRSVAGTTTTSLAGTASGFIVNGEQLYTTAGIYSWTAPTGLSSSSAVCIGGGGGSSNTTYGAGGGGGGLGYKNSYSVTGGSSYQVVVGAAGTGTSNAGDSYVVNTTTLKGGAGGKGSDSWNGSGYNAGTAGNYTGDDGQNGGSGGAYSSFSNAGNPTNSAGGSGGNAYGGGAGGGGAGGYGSGISSGGGGGAAYRQSSQGNGSGAGGGGGGSGGSSGENGKKVGGMVDMRGGTGGAYGGGAGYEPSWGNPPGTGGAGAVRIIWGTGRSFSSNAS